MTLTISRGEHRLRRRRRCGGARLRGVEEGRLHSERAGCVRCVGRWRGGRERRGRGAADVRSGRAARTCTRERAARTTRALRINSMRHRALS
jgi:hypothetical protein